FLINNEGFTIERWIHGMEEVYNDIATWNYTDIPKAFGATDKQAKTWIIKTKDEVEKLLSDPKFQNGEGLQLVELRMPKEDAPRALKVTAQISAKNNARLE
ncbi:pyruvate decarboxylase, partial [Podospora conica]